MNVVLCSFSVLLVAFFCMRGVMITTAGNRAIEIPGMRYSSAPSAVRTYREKMVFTHDAGPNPGNDSVGVIQGEGMQSPLIATSYQWPRVRVGRSGIPSVVFLKNKGNASVRILDVNFTGDVGDFTLNATQVRGVTIAAGDSVPVDVTFTPTTTGIRHTVATYTTDPPQQSSLVSTLTGAGVMPVLATHDYDFGMYEIGTRVYHIVEFWIPSGPGFEYTDTVTITGVRLRSDQSTTGTPDFDYSLPDNPIRLIPGRTDRIAILASFQPGRIGPRRAELTALTADGADTTSNWTGRGVSQHSAVPGATDALIRFLQMNLE